MRKKIIEHLTLMQKGEAPGKTLVDALEDMIAKKVEAFTDKLIASSLTRAKVAQVYARTLSPVPPEDGE